MLKQIFSDKKISFLVILLAVVARIIQLIYFFNIRVDGMYQALATQNFVTGHGFSNSFVSPSNLSSIIYEPQINWPPGYSLLLSPFYLLLNNNYIYAGIALDILAAIALIFITRKILRILSAQEYIINLFTLMMAFYIYPFYFICSSDAIAITFFTLAIYHTLKLFISSKEKTKSLIIIAIGLTLSGLTKYLFIPIVFVVPLFLYWRGYTDKNISLKKSGTLLFGTLFLLLGSLLLWQKLNSGSATYISSTERGFYPENILNTYPALSASVISPETIDLSIAASQNTCNIIFRLSQIIHFILVVVGIAYLIRYIKRKKQTLQQNFFYLSVLISISIIILLSIISLFVGKEENIPGHWWTYVEDSRYYGLLIILMQLSIFTFLSLNKSYFIKAKYIIVIAFLFFLPETLRGIIFTGNRILKAGSEEYSWQYEKSIQDYSKELMDSQLKKYPEAKAAVTGNSYYMYYRIGMSNGIPVMNDTKTLNNVSALNAKRPTLLFIVEDENNPLAKPENSELIGYFRGYTFYMIYVQPH